MGVTCGRGRELYQMLGAGCYGRYLFQLSRSYPDDWMKDWRFLIGGSLFIIGYMINRSADTILRGLRETGQGEYGIPRQGMYRWISCPNYLGEIMIWVGWAVATWSVVGWAFAVWTMANLVPRAWAHHRWYQERFPDYPPRRKALLPGVW
jgi:steroid 5-alpha reductase family enzyme